MKILIALFSASIISYTGCSTDITGKVPPFSIEVKKTESWFDLMPGSDHVLYLMGEIQLINNSANSFTKTGIDRIIISAAGKEYFNFNPVSETSGIPVQPGDTVVINYKADPPLKLVEELPGEESFNILFILFADNLWFEYQFENYRPEKAY